MLKGERKETGIRCFSKMILKSAYGTKILKRIFFLPQSIEVAHLNVKTKSQTKEIVHLSSNTLQTFRKVSVNAYVHQLIDFKFLLLRILQWCWQAFWCMFGREDGEHHGVLMNGLRIRYNLRKKKLICQLLSSECGVLIVLYA